MLHDVLTEKTRMKVKKESTKEGEMIETTRITKVGNLTILLKKKLMLNLKVMMMKLSMLL